MPGTSRARWLRHPRCPSASSTSASAPCRRIPLCAVREDLSGNLVALLIRSPPSCCCSRLSMSRRTQVDLPEYPSPRTRSLSDHARLDFAVRRSVRGSVRQTARSADARRRSAWLGRTPAQDPENVDDGARARLDTSALARRQPQSTATAAAMSVLRSAATARRPRLAAPEASDPDRLAAQRLSGRRPRRIGGGDRAGPRHGSQCR